MTSTLTEAGGAPGAPDPVRPRDESRWASIARSTELQLLIGLALFSVVFVLLYPDTFGTVQNVKNMSTVAGILLVVAIGQTMALLVGGFDLSVSANMGFVSIVASLHARAAVNFLPRFRMCSPVVQPGCSNSPPTLYCTCDGAPPPPRTDADASLRICLSSAQHGRRRSSLCLAYLSALAHRSTGGA